MHVAYLTGVYIYQDEQVSGKSSEVAIELSILVSWIATTCGWWKSRKASNSSFLPLKLLIFMLMNFNPLIKLLLFVPQGEDLSFFSFVRGTNLFSVSKFTCSPKKESEKLKNSHFGQFHIQFILFTVSYWVSAMNEHSSANLICSVTPSFFWKSDCYLSTKRLDIIKAMIWIFGYIAQMFICCCYWVGVLRPFDTFKIVSGVVS